MRQTGEGAKTLIVFMLFLAVLLSFNKVNGQEGYHVLNKGKPWKFFRYRKNNPIIVSGHRGGREQGYPENSLEGFKNILRQMPAFFEIDPRLTRDSVIVLMHDATLDRTTTGKGRLNEFTFEQLENVRLKDSEGNVTPYSIPTLEEVIIWAKGRTVVNLDRKDVDPAMIVDMIRKLGATDHVMLTVHTGAQARYYHDNLPEVMLSAFIRDSKEYEDMASSGVPWKNMIAYIGPTIDERNRDIVRLLHSHGVKCMISVAPTHDKLLTPLERKEGFLKEISLMPDIIESDNPVEVWNVIKENKAKPLHRKH